MATGVTAESVLSMIVEGHLECSICHARYEDPKILDCSHSFCLKCLEEYKRVRQHARDLRCPICQHETTLPNGKVANLCNNFDLMSILDEVSKQEKLLYDEEPNITCQACDEENEAISCCMDCKNYLCHKCQKAHERLSFLKAHKISTLAELRASDSNTDETVKRRPNCESHPHQMMCFYCYTCEKLICKLCAAQSHNPNTHSYADLGTAFDICLQDFQSEISERYTSDIFANVSKNTKSLKTRLGIMLEETNNYISQSTEMRIREIRQVENRLKQEATAVYRRKDKKLSKMAFVEQLFKVVQSEASESSHLEILKLRQDLLQEYKDVEEESGDPSLDLSFISFKMNQEMVKLGTLLQKEKWEREMSSAAASGDFIAAFSTGHLVVADTAKGTLHKLTPNGETDCKKNLRDLAAIAVNKDDQLIVLAGFAVKTFDKQLQLLREFSPLDEAVRKRLPHVQDCNRPTCLAVDENNTLAVGFKNKKKISLYNFDGSLVRILESPLICKYLTMSNGVIIYTNSHEKKLIEMDYEGNNESTCMFDNDRPYGVCHNKAGDIYLVTHLCPEIPLHRMHSIQLYSCQTHTVCSKFSINNSLGARYSDITCTPNGRLAIVGSKVKMYQRV